MKTVLLSLSLVVLGLANLHAQKMFSYQDVKGKPLSQAQVDQLEKQFQGFLGMEIIKEGNPLVVQVSTPSPQEWKYIQNLRHQELEALKKKWLGKPLPTFALQSLDNKVLVNKNLIGRKTLFFFWSKSNYVSLNQFASLTKLLSSFKGKPVQFWAITFEDKVLIKDFLKLHPFAFVHAPGDFSFVMEKMGIVQTPVFLLTDSKGIVRYLDISNDKNIGQRLATEIAKIK